MSSTAVRSGSIVRAYGRSRRDGDFQAAVGGERVATEGLQKCGEREAARWLDRSHP